MNQPELEKPDAPPPPRPARACGKCGTVLLGEKHAYWHGRKDSAGCIRALVGMVLELHRRLSIIEGVPEKAAATPAEEGRTA